MCLTHIISHVLSAQKHLDYGFKGLKENVRLINYGIFQTWYVKYVGNPVLEMWCLVIFPTVFDGLMQLKIGFMQTSRSIWKRAIIRLRFLLNCIFDSSRTLLWFGIGLLPILGATWTVMLLSVNEMNPMLSYFVPLFCLVQAVYIFLGYCIFNKKVRPSVYSLLDSIESNIDGRSSRTQVRLQLRYAWLRMKGEKVPYDASLSGTRTTIASVSEYSILSHALHCREGLLVSTDCLSSEF